MRGKVISVLSSLTFATAILAQTTAFTYQGELNAGNQPANGLHDLRLRLFDAQSDGTQVGVTMCINNVQVTNGKFSTLIDFGPQFTTIAPRFLEIIVRADIGQPCSEDLGYVTLSPRQRLTATPFANHARSAFTLAAQDGSPTNAVLVDNDGKVGIGTLAPTHSVHIANAAPTLALQDTDSTTQQVGYISYRDSGNVERAWVGYGSTGDPDFSIINARTGGDIVLNPFAGNVGIGTASPTEKLSVAGTLSATNIGSQSLSTNSVFSTRSTPGSAIIGIQSVQGSTAILGQISVPSLTAANAIMGNSGCNTANCFGVFANGRLGATGTKSFRIDHPDAPSTHYLFHYSTEGPEAINFYRGTVTLDNAGRAVVMLPAYFAKINTDPSYQLTAIGAAMPALHVSIKISDEALRAGSIAGAGVAADPCWFKIDGGVAFGEVSWRVEAARNDEYVRRFGAPVEVEKPAHEMGRTDALLSNMILNRE